jgi:hypothetical protein
MEPNRKLFPDHLPFILLHGVAGGCWFTVAQFPFEKTKGYVTLVALPIYILKRYL